MTADVAMPIAVARIIHSAAQVRRPLQKLSVRERAGRLAIKPLIQGRTFHAIAPEI